MNTLRQIKDDVSALAKRIGASNDDLPTYGTTRDFGYPHVEVDESRYHYVTVERGLELSRQSTAVYEELLYWIFAHATHNLAFAYELANGVEDQDCRRIAFSKQLELLNCIRPEMAARRAREIDQILCQSPYDDESIRALNRMQRNKAT